MKRHESALTGHITYRFVKSSYQLSDGVFWLLLLKNSLFTAIRGNYGYWALIYYADESGQVLTERVAGRPATPNRGLRVSMCTSYMLTGRLTGNRPDPV